MVALFTSSSIIGQVCCMSTERKMRCHMDLPFRFFPQLPLSHPSLVPSIFFSEVSLSLNNWKRGKITRSFQKYTVSSCADMYSFLADSSASNLSQHSGSDWSRNSLLRHRTSLSVVIDQMTNFSGTSNSSKGLFVNSSSKVSLARIATKLFVLIMLITTAVV